jgi:hypothetical protein
VKVAVVLGAKVDGEEELGCVVACFWTKYLSCTQILSIIVSNNERRILNRLRKSLGP